MQRYVRKVRNNSPGAFFCGLLAMESPMLVDEQKLTNLLQADIECKLDCFGYFLIAYQP